jgi:hypothetical protein
LLAAFDVVGCRRTGIDAAAAPPAGYRLVWADEFETDGLPDPAAGRTTR